VKLEIDVGVRVGDFELAAAAELDGRVWGIQGPSGSGKTTLLHTIAGLRRPERGRIVLDGETLFDSSCRRNVAVHRRRIGYVFQEGRLFPHLTVQGNLRYAEKRAGASARLTGSDVTGLLDLSSLCHRDVETLSGGEQKRVAIARALLANPRLLLLDEPMAGVDHGQRAVLLSYLARISESLELPMVIVSHDLGTILSLTDLMVLMERGRVHSCGPTLHLPTRELGNVAAGPRRSASVAPVKASI
jgi:molybdate transport system ATP-binding protein